MEEELLQPAGQDSEQQSSDGAAAPATPPSLEGSPPAAGGRQRRENPLAQRGRELADERRRREAAEGQVVALNARLTALESRDAQREQAYQEARLSQLSPTERNAEEIQMLRGEIARLTQAQQPQPETTEQYRARRSAELIAQANEIYGLGGENAIRPEHLPQSAWLSEQAFIASLEALGSRVQQATQGAEEGEEPVAGTKGQQNGTPSAEEITQRVLRELGVGRSNTAHPAGGGKVTAPTDADFMDAGFGYNSKQGPRASIERYRELKERAGEAAQR